MDVVRNTIERLGGRVAVSSQRQRGTTVRFTLPFTVMMTQVLTVEAAGQVFGVPLEAVVETVRVEPRRHCARRRRPRPGAARPHAAGHRPGPGPGARGPRVRRRCERADRRGCRPAAAASRSIAWATGMDVMLKPPEGLLAGIPGIDGTTLLGDGRVLIVLDLGEIFGNADG